MTVEHSVVAPRWLIITPTLAIQQWLESIRVGAAASGLNIVIEGFGAPVVELDRPDLIVTDEVDRALASGAESIVVVIPTPWSAPDALEAQGEDPSTALISASRRLAEACSLDARHRIIGSDQLLTEGAPLQLFPDLVISTPHSVSGTPSSLAKAGAAHILRDLYAAGRVSDQVSSAWPLEIFAYHTSALVDGRLGEFDLTGRPKFLVSGPYLWMPAGTWTARIRFSIDDDASQRQFRLDWGGVTEWTEQRFTPDHSGTYEMELTHIFAHAQACEVRLLIAEGCFSGRADFHGATISRAPSPSGL